MRDLDNFKVLNDRLGCHFGQFAAPRCMAAQYELDRKRIMSEIIERKPVYNLLNDGVYVAIIKRMRLRRKIYRTIDELQTYLDAWPVLSPDKQSPTDRTVIIRKSEKAQVRVERGMWNGVEVIDLRLWRRFRETDTFVPTKKALTVHIGMREALIQALEAMSGLEE